MKLKLNKLVMACGSLFAAGMSTQASAVDLYVSGASALQISFGKVVAEMCDPAPAAARAFFTNAGGQSYQCMSRATGSSAPFPGVSKPLNIWKRNAGGSGFGIFPVANTGIPPKPPNPAPYNKVTFVNKVGCLASGTVVIGGLTWANNVNCPSTGHIPPDAGLSDVEPALFGYTGNGLSITRSIVAQVFGVPVNDKLYRKLQALQGIPAEPVGVFDPAKAPSLTYAQVRTLFNGTGMTDWSVVHTDITHAGNTSIDAKVCRSTATSGTQAVFNALFENNPCGILGTQLVTADNNGDNNGSNDGPDNGSTATGTINTASFFASTVGGYTVVMNSGNAQVDACLTDADNKGELAIGFLGTERVSSQMGAPPAEAPDDADGRADKWHYVKLSGGNQDVQLVNGAIQSGAPHQHGAYPSVDNTINSTYDIYAEAFFNRRGDSSYPGGITGDLVKLMNKFYFLMSSPTTIRIENLLGLAALATNGYDPSLPAKYPTLKGMRYGNTCAPTLLLYPNPS